MRVARLARDARRNRALMEGIAQHDMRNRVRGLVDGRSVQDQRMMHASSVRSTPGRLPQRRTGSVRRAPRVLFMSRCVFPLRTSVEWFDDPVSPTIEGRVKQAAVLYDELLFEDGFVEIDITDGGAMHMWYPPEAATPERLEEANRPIETGAPVVFSLGKQPAQGVPAAPEDMHVMMAGSLQQRYVAELVYSVMSRFADYNDGWGQITFTGNRSAHDLDRWLPHRSTRALRDEELMPDLREEHPWLRDFVVKAFDRDATLAEELDATFNVSPLFQPMLGARRPEAATPTSEETLTYFFPDVSDLPWEVVMEFREHDAAGEARARLQEAVERAQADGITAADNQLTRDMLFAERELRKRHSLVERVTKMAVSVVPVAGGVLSEGAGAAAEGARGKHDWVAALRLLRQ